MLTGHHRRTLQKAVMWVKDGMCTNVERWVLGPCEKFITGPHMIVSVNGIAIVVRRPPPQLLEEAPGAVLHYVDTPERKPKISRPPNAFILYRRDYQAQIKAMNPRLMNNDICKSTCRFTLPLARKLTSEKPAFWEKPGTTSRMRYRSDTGLSQKRTRSVITNCTPITGTRHGSLQRNVVETARSHPVNPLSRPHNA